MDDIELMSTHRNEFERIALVKFEWKAGLWLIVYTYYFKPCAMISDRASSCATEQIEQPGHNGSLVAESAFFGPLYAALSHVLTPNR